MDNNPIGLNDPKGLDPKKGKRNVVDRESQSEKPKSPSFLKKIATYVKNFATGKQYINRANSEADKRGISRDKVTIRKDPKTGQKYASFFSGMDDGSIGITGHKFWSGGKKKEPVDPRTVAGYWGKEYSKPTVTQFTVNGVTPVWKRLFNWLSTDKIATSKDGSSNPNGTDKLNPWDKADYVPVDDMMALFQAYKKTQGAIKTGPTYQAPKNNLPTRLNAFEKLYERAADYFGEEHNDGDGETEEYEACIFCLRKGDTTVVKGHKKHKGWKNADGEHNILHGGVDNWEKIKRKN